MAREGLCRGSPTKLDTLLHCDIAFAGPNARDGLAFHHADYLTATTERPDLLMAIDVFELVED